MSQVLFKQIVNKNKEYFVQNGIDDRNIMFINAAMMGLTGEQIEKVYTCNYNVTF